MVAFQPGFEWFERVEPPDHPDKTVHVRNHWRRPPGSLKLETRPKHDEGPTPRITLQEPQERS